MNKQETTEFILQELANHRAPAEIAGQLSVLLNAPKEAVERFVLQVAAQRPPATSPAPPAAPAAPAPLPPASAPPETKYPPLPTAHTPPAEPEPQAAHLQPAGTPLEGESAYPALPTAHTPAAEPALQPWETKAPLKNDLLENEELTADVLRRLKKGEDRNDIITMVCERAGTSWPQAQRLVSQVEVDNYQPLTFKRNIPVFLGSTIAGLFGIAIMLGGLMAATPYLAALSGGPISAPPVPSILQMAPDIALTAMIAGSGLVLGSIAGIYYALQEHRL